ncbi:protein TIC110, chloroplastic-like [Lactuca sativa]|uniref:protein TIC110, chloroplastic-like n=1 Tax=Lactuca sativa TaxID=4236 RepID=UPI0022AF8342|nr:protein TIC110, chloroplastic-like [Lactuca sativa]
MFTTFCNALILTSLFLEIYRQNLQQSMKDGELSDAEVKSLERLQVMLCIPKQTIEKIHEEICGTLFEKVVKEAIAAGVDGYDADVKQAVRKAAYGLRITREVAMSIAGKAVSVFYGFALVYFSFSVF